jgi:hypothetical protein
MDILLRFKSWTLQIFAPVTRRSNQTMERMGKELRVPYSAVYYFYVSKP